MALNKTMQLTNSFGEQSSIDCYIKVAEVRSSKSDGVIRVDIKRNGTESVLESRDILFPPDMQSGAPNIWEQAYLFMKTLPEFADAQDC